MSSTFAFQPVAEPVPGRRFRGIRVYGRSSVQRCNKRTALAVGDLILLVNGENVVATAHQTELADLIIELAAGNTDQDSFIESYVEMLERSDQPR